MDMHGVNQIAKRFNGVYIPRLPVKGEGVQEALHITGLHMSKFHLAWLRMTCLFLKTWHVTPC